MNHFLVVSVGDRLADAQKDVQALRQEFHAKADEPGGRQRQRRKQAEADKTRAQKLEDAARRRAQKLEDEERRRAQKLEDEARRKAEREKEKKEAEEKRKAERIRSKIETQLISAGGQMLKRGLLGILKK